MDEIKTVEKVLEKLCIEGFSQNNDFQTKKALQAIREIVEEAIPKETCPIIRALNKRFKCKGCSQAHLCRERIQNKLISDIKANLEKVWE